ncbi:hypothetical protein Vadar_000026 [Vaccinium darrowii]|uniref:Uncharacterized protein n=1 Tax=Vaccinium darrowii TaxID=229202 RepID=A0ACB7X6S9_9ERIC|nr:hypothetical protein Vadar_000026 [Vaccinium darrowii]
MAIPTAKSHLLILSLLISTAVACASGECEADSSRGCHDKSKALHLKLIAIPTILVASMVGICLPLFTRSVKSLSPDTDLFLIVKAFSSGVILATGYMHVLPDSFDDLKSECLPRNPWKYPFTTLVAMVAAVLTMMVDSFALCYYRKKDREIKEECRRKRKTNVELGQNCSNGNDNDKLNDSGTVDDQEVEDKAATLLRHRVVAQVLELGIVVHSVVIGLSMGASDNPCTIRPLVAALCFHQLFEGMGLGGCILQAEYGAKMKAIMVFFFSATTPFGIALGIGLSNIYSENSPAALIVVGVLNATSAGLLNYMALVDLLAHEFFGNRKLLESMELQMWAYLAVFSGAGGMSLMAKWA